jgi:hypothetical protein
MKLNDFLKDKRNWQVPDLPGGAPQAPSPQPGANPAPAPDAGPDLSFIPTDFHTDGKPDLGKFSAHYQEIVAAQARAAENAPQIPEAYAFDLPADLKFEGMDLPEGFAFEVDKDNPLFSELGAALKELGAPADAGPKMTALLAKYEAAKAAADFAAWKQDMAQLGTPAQQTARAQDVQRKLETLLPKAQVEALFSGDRISADGIRALEKLITGRSLQAPAPQPAGPDLESLTPRQRLDLANQQRAQARA